MSLSQEILFYLYTTIVLFIPGYFLLLSIFAKDIRKLFSPLETFILAFGTSLVSVNFLIIILNKAGFSITKFSIILSLIAFVSSCFLVYRYKSRKNHPQKIKIASPTFSASQTTLIIILLLLTIFIKTIYLKDAIFPTSTDLGHHMYWSKLISQTGELPVYESLEIIKSGDTYKIEKEAIADFIIGEHLIFSSLNLLSGADFFSAFPVLILFLINIFSILTIFILTLRIFSEEFLKNISPKLNIIRDPKNIAIMLLFILGPLYAIASPQAKFLSGGVIGNVIGNLLIPLSLYFYFRALREKSKSMLFLAILMSAGMFFFHHLSALIFIIIFLFIIIAFEIIFTANIIIFNKKKKVIAIFHAHLKLAKNYFLNLFSLSNMLLLIAIVIFTLFIYTPSYLNIDATSTAVGAPSKATRAGLTPSQFKYAVGEPRLALGMIGFALLTIMAFFRKKGQEKVITKNIIAPVLLIGWSLAVLIMSLKPHWIYINIPSGRVANYANFPFAIIASFGLVWILYFVQNTTLKKNFLPTKIIQIFFILIFVTFISAGYFDNSQSLTTATGNQSALRTFHASAYLSEKIDDTAKPMILKDHNYIKADAWIKLFFMEDYSYPLSRGFFKRYDDPTKPREMCTLWMIESPSSASAEQCYTGTGTKFIMVNPFPDSIQFEKNNNFWKIYSGEDIEIFYKS